MLDLKLMIVEDDEALVESMQRILSREVSTVSAYLLPQDALRAFAQELPDIVMTDIKMPKMSGLEMVGKMREIKPELKVIVASAFNETQYFHQAEAVKVDYFFVKPIDIGEVLQAIIKLA